MSRAREYLLSSQRYYGSAVQQIARSINRNSLSSPSHILAVLVLFCYFESAMGNFIGFGCHAQGVYTFIQTHFAAIASDQLGRELTAAWILAKNHNWWLRMHFSSVSLQLRQPSLALPPDISHILLAINARRAVVTSILCESYRLNNVALLQLWPCGHRHPDLTVDQCIASLEIESKKLDEWHSALPQCELPIESFPGFDALDRESGNFHPLLFTSHTLAMNYAYYACSRILQCTTLFHNLRQPQNPSATAAETETETNYWIRIILRIVAGLDKQTCFRENVYSIGISSLLAACLLRCHDSIIGTWIETWLSDWRSNNSALEEGSFPIAQVWELTRLINEEKAAGDDIYAIALPEDDGGGRGKNFALQEILEAYDIHPQRRSSDCLSFRFNRQAAAQLPTDDIFASSAAPSHLALISFDTARNEDQYSNKVLTQSPKVKTSRDF
ncbi:hypothetical protein N8T08_009587 [Aspergillus melleus]|uniref:Uncharacterized protein n=1 Tax=Aspergillus melleus TaxID=138277 RepID=A0ACC3BDK1_9EURO|nr:hypothetical protein N8T08_009587 [Aspergillus melleus]